MFPKRDLFSLLAIFTFSSFFSSFCSSFFSSFSFNGFNPNKLIVSFSSFLFSCFSCDLNNPSPNKVLFFLSFSFIASTLLLFSSFFSSLFFIFPNKLEEIGGNISILFSFSFSFYISSFANKNKVFFLQFQLHYLYYFLFLHF